MINIDSMINHKSYGLYKDTGKNIDSFFCSQIYLFKETNRFNPFTFEFISNDIKNWEILSKDSNIILFDKLNSNNIFAIYYPCENYPFLRMYYLSVGEINKYSIDKLIDKYNAKDVILNASLLLDDIENRTKKANDWFKEMDKIFDPLTKIANGRIENTTIDKTIVLSRQPKGCVACGEKPTGYISSILKGSNTIFFIANICEEHQECAKTYPNFLNYILNLLESGVMLAPFQMKENISRTAIDLLFKEIAKELDAPEIISDRQYREDIDQTTGIFKRETGFTIIIRLKTLMKYGYIIEDPNGKQFKRIDSADHHKDRLAVGPDHIHHDPHKKTKDQNIKPSFTTGFPLFDIPAIKKIVEDAENE